MLQGKSPSCDRVEVFGTLEPSISLTCIHHKTDFNASTVLCLPSWLQQRGGCSPPCGSIRAVHNKPIPSNDGGSDSSSLLHSTAEATVRMTPRFCHSHTSARTIVVMSTSRERRTSPWRAHPAVIGWRETSSRHPTMKRITTKSTANEHIKWSFCRADCKLK